VTQPLRDGGVRRVSVVFGKENPADQRGITRGQTGSLTWQHDTGRAQQSCGDKCGAAGNHRVKVEGTFRILNST
jgi:hypothetical protein